MSTLRHHFVPRIFAACIAFALTVGLMPTVCSASELLTGWYEFGDTNGQFESGAGKAPDVGLSGVDGSIVGGDGSRAAWSSTDGFFGDSTYDTGAGDTAADASPTANGSMTLRTLSGDSMLNLTITNNAPGTYLQMDSLYFDTTNLDRSDTPDALELKYLSGDLSDPDDTTINSVAGLAKSGFDNSTGDTFSDWRDFGWSLGSLSDTQLDYGESMTLQFVASDADTEGAAMGIDNFALTGESVTVEQVLLGWYDFTADGSDNYESGAGKAADVKATGVDGTIVGGDGNRDAWSSTDGLYGDSAFETGAGDTAAAETPVANGGMAIRTLIQGSDDDSQLNITVTNNNAALVTLSRLLFDYEGLTGAGPTSTDTITLTYLSGDLSDADGTTIGSLTGIAGGGNSFSDYEDFGFDLAAVLADLDLAPGESATFQLLAQNTNATGSEGVPVALDNFSLTGTVAAIPAPAALPAGLMLLAALGVRRRK